MLFFFSFVSDEAMERASMRRKFVARGPPRPSTRGSTWEEWTDVGVEACAEQVPLPLQAVTDAHGVDTHGVGANSAPPHGLG